MQQLLFLLVQSNAHDSDANNVRSAFLWILALLVLIIAGRWATFVKAGYPGWTSIFPGYQALIRLEIAEIPLWFFLISWIIFPHYILLTILSINELFWWILALSMHITIIIIFEIFISIKLARAFGRSILFGLGLVFLPFIFYPILGFTRSS